MIQLLPDYKIKVFSFTAEDTNILESYFKEHS